MMGAAVWTAALLAVWLVGLGVALWASEVLTRREEGDR
jgi:hypothetical protein